MARQRYESHESQPRAMRTGNGWSQGTGGTTDNGGERLLGVQEAAALLGVRPRTLYQWAYKRRIPVVKLFGRHGALRFRLHDVQRLINDSVRPAAGSAERLPE